MSTRGILMKNGIFEVTTNDVENVIKNNDPNLNLTITVNTENIHDDKSFIMTVGLAWGMLKEDLQKIENINWFNDVLSDFIYSEYEDEYNSFVLVLENWSKLTLDSIFEFGGYEYNDRKKEDYLEVFNVLIEQFSEYDEDYPEDNLMDFTILLVD